MCTAKKPGIVKVTLMGAGLVGDPKSEKNRQIFKKAIEKN